MELILNAYFLSAHLVKTRSPGTTLKGFCPIRNIKTEYPPTMLLHEDMDEDVPYEASVNMVEALDADMQDTAIKVKKQPLY